MAHLTHCNIVQTLTPFIVSLLPLIGIESLFCQHNKNKFTYLSLREELFSSNSYLVGAVWNILNLEDKSVSIITMEL